MHSTDCYYFLYTMYCTQERKTSKVSSGILFSVLLRSASR